MIMSIVRRNYGFHYCGAIEFLIRKRKKTKDWQKKKAAPLITLVMQNLCGDRFFGARYVFSYFILFKMVFVDSFHCEPKQRPMPILKQRHREVGPTGARGGVICFCRLFHTHWRKKAEQWWALNATACVFLRVFSTIARRLSRRARLIWFSFVPFEVQSYLSQQDDLFLNFLGVFSFRCFSYSRRNHRE